MNYLIIGDLWRDNRLVRYPLPIIVDDGRAYDPDLAGYPEGRVELTEDGMLRAPGHGVSFRPEPGELDRIGREVF